MKKIYETPECRVVIVAKEDVLTASFTKVEKQNTEGDFSGGGIIKWRP